MKKCFFLLLCLVTLAYSSCRKTYTCVCQAIDTTGAPMNYNAKTNGSMNDAQMECNAQRLTYDTSVYKQLRCAVPN